MLLHFNPKTEFKLYIEIAPAIRDMIFTDIYVPVCNCNMLMRESLSESVQRLCLLRDRALATVKRGRDHTMSQPLFVCLCNVSGSISCWKGRWLPVVWHIPLKEGFESVSRAWCSAYCKYLFAINSALVNPLTQRYCLREMESVLQIMQSFRV